MTNEELLEKLKNKKDTLKKYEKVMNGSIFAPLIAMECKNVLYEIQDIEKELKSRGIEL